MPASRTRGEARDRINRTFYASLERIIPEDESVPLRGSVFLDFEKQVEQVRQDVLPVVLEERARLDEQARETSVQSFEPAARALVRDWGLETLDGRQVQRWVSRWFGSGTGRFGRIRRGVVRPVRRTSRR